MERLENGDFDFSRLRMEKWFRTALEKTEENQSTEQIPGMGFSIILPGGFVPAGEDAAAGIYRSRKRPSVIFIAEGGKTGITFQQLSGEQAGETLSSCRERIRQIIGQIDKRNVFYDVGEREKAVWFDYKSFAGKETVYNMVFLFRAGEKKIMGTFYCMFEAYDRWRSEILEMIDTIKTEEKEE